MAGNLTLKWGTIKGWGNLDEAAVNAMNDYIRTGVSESCMGQKDTPEQKELICAVIDVVDEPIWNDWSGDKMSREEAKKYVREYGG